MLILAHLTDHPAHGDEIKTHVERPLSGSSALHNNLPYPAPQREAVLRNHLAHVAALLRVDQRTGHRFGAQVVQFLTRQSEQELERIAFPAEETRGKTL
jgi:hypothetical protein